MSESAARRLVKKQVAGALGDYVELAKAVCAAAVTGVPDEAPKKSAGMVSQETSHSRMEKSDSPQSTDGAAPSASMSVQ
jgi:hypothetical protein